MPKAFVVGHPIAHSRSPLIHGYWLTTHGLEGSYERIDVAPQDFPGFLREFPGCGFVGGNVTLPHKEAAFAGVEHVTKRAARLGAVNTLWLENGALHGDNTDVTGFLASIDAHCDSNWADACGTALVLGAGGAARAVVAGLAERGIGRIHVVNRSPEKAALLAGLAPGQIHTHGLDALDELLPAAGLIVNTTSLGMIGQPPLDIDLVPCRDDAIVSDIVYTPLETPLLAQARARGLIAVDGLGMLLHQAVPGFARWFGVTPKVTQALRDHVCADLLAGKGNVQ
jgi:shikimate dehydrogenase